MNPHRIYSSIYKQLIHIRPNVELFPNLTTLGNSREKASHWANVEAPEIEAVLWSSGARRNPYIALQHFQQLQRITIKPSPLDPNVLHKYSHALSASAVRELDLRFVRWPDPRLQSVSPVFPSLRKLIVDGSPSHGIEFVQLLSSPVLQDSGYTQLLMLLADKYRGVFRALKIQHPLLCHDQAGFESFLPTVRTLADAGVGTLQLNLIVGWQELTREGHISSNES
ncbi:hypothetical protein EV363DRAFT_1430141 [Boletus edulis]|nr:hypothetical protein EV363DRAFT_1430141 [Boletus edulis]